MASGEEGSKGGIPLDELQHYRGVAQEQSMNAVLSAQQRFEHATANADSTRDCIYDAIADAKKQIEEKDKIPFGGDNKDGHEEKSVTNESGEQQEGEENGSKGVLSSLGDALSGYAKNVKEAVGGNNVDNGNNSK